MYNNLKSKLYRICMDKSDEKVIFALDDFSFNPNNGNVYATFIKTYVDTKIHYLVDHIYSIEYLLNL